MKKAVFALVLLLSSVSALKMSFQRRAPPNAGAPVSANFDVVRGSLAAGDENDDGTTELANVADIRYTTDILINGVKVHVALDTGSTDIWVAPPDGLGVFNDTGIPLSLAYGDGSYGVAGKIAVSEFEFGDYSIKRQAYLAVDEANVSGLFEHGIYGLLGLSFNSVSASPINAAVQEVYGPEATWGHSALRNIFEQHPDQPNFIALDLARTEDLEDTSGGSFGIGEYDEDYIAIKNAPKLAQFPKGGDRWTTLLEGVTVDGKAIPLKPKTEGVPSGHHLTLLDTGDPYALIPTYLADAIYSRIPGSVPYDGADGRVWLVPCNANSSVAFIFGGEEFPIHPLDLSNIRTIDVASEDTSFSVCVSTLKGVDDWSSAYEISLGDSFLRNVYTVFDFGDTLPDGTVGEPYMQLLSQLDVKEAAGEVEEVRSRTLATHPPEIDPITALAYLTGNVDSASASSKHKSDGVVSEEVEAESSNVKSTAQAVSAWPYGSVVMLGLLGANTVMLLVLSVFVILLWVRRGRTTVVKQDSRYLPLHGQEK